MLNIAGFKFEIVSLTNFISGTTRAISNDFVKCRHDSTEKILLQVYIKIYDLKVEIQNFVPF